MAPLRTWATFVALGLGPMVQAWHNEEPPCPSEFAPFEYSGCYADADGKSLVYRSSVTSDGMTVEACSAICKGNGFRYSGLKYYGICFCGNVVDGDQLDESECSFPCNGNADQVCGGDDSLSVHSDPTFPDPDQVDEDDYVDIGCWTDDSTAGRALSWPQDQLSSSEMTPQLCIAACRAGGFPHAGVEYGSECWCGALKADDSIPAQAAECDMPCHGDSSQLCGGRGRIQIYLAEGFQSQVPCGEEKPDLCPVPSESAVPSTSDVPSVPPVPSSTEVPSVPPAPSSSEVPPVPSSSEVPSAPPAPSSSEVPPVPSSSDVPSAPPAPSSSPVASSSAVVSPEPSQPPSTFSSVVITSEPAATSSAPAICTTEVVVPPTSEYCCGRWCSDPIPHFDNKLGCLAAKGKCVLQTAACLGTAGWPGSLECLKFGKWCADLGTYCLTTCKPGKDCSKADFISDNPPRGGEQPTTTTSTIPCTETAAPTPEPTVPVVPEPTSICVQPKNRLKGYGPGNPVGGIEMPFVTCNDVEEDFNNGFHFKHYLFANTLRCPAYKRNQVKGACVDACKEQGESCRNVYAKSQLQDKGFLAWVSATALCKAQEADCLKENKNVSGGDHCTTFGQF
ncbi:hypothetical protein ACRALDRAFT_1077437 [Sodiomyces alcalophilus JCM 7366]|uniref:uncharacterized protein n=1 Tax=Sodiomyces alcalophilus JCM 7366 TaxID=591952 RepID=UPI0039B558C2